MLDATRAIEAEVWAVSGVGRALPARLWHALAARLALPPPTTRTAASAYFDHVRAPGAVATMAGVWRVAGPVGVVTPDEALAQCDCPEPPELLSGW
jgi:hypothetical protein